jgi:hypothetical protein
MTEKALCQLCGEPMPTGEEMFKYHGYSGNCPKPPKSQTTNAIERHDGPLTLAALNDMTRQHKASPVGFIVSTELLEMLKEAARGDAPIIKQSLSGETFSGLPIITDPAMPPTEFEIAFTAEAWRKRLAELRK